MRLLPAPVHKVRGTRPASLGSFPRNDVWALADIHVIRTPWLCIFGRLN